MGWDNARLPVPDTLPPEIAALILQTWADPAERPGFGDIIDRLKPLLLAPSLYPEKDPCALSKKESTGDVS